MSVITKGKTFANGEQLTAGKLNQMLDAATFSAAAVDNTKTTLSGGAITIAPNAITTTEIAQSFLDTIYPIGSIYTNATDGTNPGTLLGFGTWVQFASGRFPLGFGETTDTRGETLNFDEAGSEGGSYKHLLTHNESGLPSHSHTQLGGGFDGNVGIEAGNQRGVDLGQTGTTGPQDAVTPHQNTPPYIVVYMWKRTA